MNPKPTHLTGAGTRIAFVPKWFGCLAIWLFLWEGSKQFVCKCSQKDGIITFLYHTVAKVSFTLGFYFNPQ